jgi:hypothetical protein
MPASPAPDTALNTQWHRAPSVVRSGALGSRPRKGEFPTVALTRTSPERVPGGPPRLRTTPDTPEHGSSPTSVRTASSARSVARIRTIAGGLPLAEERPLEGLPVHTGKVEWRFSADGDG